MVAMARTAMTELQQQIEQVRREAFAAGYAAAMPCPAEIPRGMLPATFAQRRPSGSTFSASLVAASASSSASVGS
jgi:hypothetical protein